MFSGREHVHAYKEFAFRIFTNSLQRYYKNACSEVNDSLSEFSLIDFNCIVIMIVIVRNLIHDYDTRTNTNLLYFHVTIKYR